MIRKEGADSSVALFVDLGTPRTPPSTRFQGSKLKLVPWLEKRLSRLNFHSALDVFGGTGTVSYLLKSLNKTVTYSDYLRCNQIIARAIVENQSVTLDSSDILYVLTKHSSVKYATFIADTFHDIYFTDKENEWLDIVVQNIALMNDVYKQAIAYFALFQSCISKRPYNLFHRKNLYVRTADVKRTFGNKATWDTPFEAMFRRFVHEANHAVFSSPQGCTSICCDALESPVGFDLVYIDSPYIPLNGTGVDYHHFYHFLEGLVYYADWKYRIDHEKKHKPLLPVRSAWSDKTTIKDAFARLFKRHRNSILVVSYRSDGIPSESEFVTMVKAVKSRVEVLHYGDYKYVLSKNDRSKELLIIGQ